MIYISKDFDPVQQKRGTNHAAVLKPDGDLCVAAGCSEGFGSVEFRAAQESLCRMGKEAFGAGVRREERVSFDEWESFLLLNALDVGTVDLYAESLSREEFRTAVRHGL